MREALITIKSSIQGGEYEPGWGIPSELTADFFLGESLRFHCSFVRVSYKEGKDHLHDQIFDNPLESDKSKLFFKYACGKFEEIMRSPVARLPEAVL